MILARNNYYPTFNSVFNDLFGSHSEDWSNYKPNRTKVAVNIKESEKEFGLEVSAPGFEKEDFEVKVENQVLTVAVHKDESCKEKSSEYTRREFCYDSFERSFKLPEGIVDEGKIEANYKNGILYITIPKSEAALPKPAKVIDIQ